MPGLDTQIANERKILHSHLSKEQRKKHRKIYAKLLAKRYPDPTKPLSGVGIEAQAEREIGGEFDPAIRGAQQRELDIPGWFDEYKKNSIGLRDSTTAAFGDTAALARTSATSGQQKSDADAAALQQQMQADAAKRGATVDPSIQATAQAAGASRRAAVEGFANQLGGQSAVVNKTFNDRIDISDRDKIDKRIAANRETGALKGKRAAAKTARVGELRDKERQYGLERAAFSLDQSKAEADAAADLAQLGIAQQNADSSSKNAQANEDRANWATDPNNPDNQPKPGKPKVTQADKKQWAKTSQTALAKIRGAIKNGVIYKSDGTRVAGVNRKNEAVIANLAQTYTGDEVLAKAIAQQLVWGGIGPGTEKALRKKFRMPIKSFGFTKSPKLYGGG